MNFLKNENFHDIVIAQTVINYDNIDFTSFVSTLDSQLLLMYYC